MTKKAYVSVNATFNLKGGDRKKPGIRREDWSFAKNNPMPLGELLALISGRLCEFYVGTMPEVSSSEINDQIQWASKRLSEFKIEDVAQK